MDRAEPPLIDRVQLEMLAEDVASALAGILETFRSEARTRLEALKHHAGAGDRSALRLEAHSLKGTAASMGLARLAHHAKCLEHGAERLGAAEIDGLIEAIGASLEQGFQALETDGFL